MIEYLIYSVNYFIFALILIVLAETLGLWFINNKMNIAQERIEFILLSF